MTDWTREQEAAAIARCEAARPGPWVRSYVASGGHGESYYVKVHSGAASVKDGRGRLIHSGCLITASSSSEHIERCRADAQFIAHARTDLPAAIRNGQRLREVLCKIWEHAMYCRALPGAGPKECTCGLEEALWGQEGDAT